MSKGIVSQKQLEANRGNALSSTGPRTPEGKARSSRNAIKHGIFAQEVLIRDGDGAEDPEQFEALLERLWDEFQPVGALEEKLVECIAVSYWRLRRAQRFEVGAIREQADTCNRPPTSSDAKEAERGLEEAKRELADALDALAWAQRQQGLHLANSCVRLRQAWLELARQHDVNISSDLNPIIQARGLGDASVALEAAGLTGDRLQQSLLETQQRIIERQRARVRELEAELAHARRADEFRRQRATLIHALPTEEDTNKLIRYETMIKRDLDRSLNRLERLQRARQGDHVPAPVALDVNVTGMQDAKEAG